MRSCFVDASLLDATTPQPLPQTLERYLIHVLRLNESAPVLLRDTRGRCRIAHLEHSPQGWQLAPTGDIEILERPPGVQIWLAPALIKQNRFSWLLEKSVELGADRISPVITARGVVQWSQTQVNKKLDRYTRVLEAAARQSQAHRPPQLDAPQALAAAAKQLSAEGARLIVAHPLASTTLLDASHGTAPLALFTGPEGGFTDAEVETLLSHGAHTVHLGLRILRAETAPLAMLAALRLTHT